jgi:hypothetical protein
MTSVKDKQSEPCAYGWGNARDDIYSAHEYVISTDMSILRRKHRFPSDQAVVVLGWVTTRESTVPRILFVLAAAPSWSWCVLVHCLSLFLSFICWPWRCVRSDFSPLQTFVNTSAGSNQGLAVRPRLPPDADKVAVSASPLAAFFQVCSFRRQPLARSH